MSGEFRRDDAYDCDVLVVGGGLVGLVASMFLAQQGLRVWVVERHAATSSHPKLRGVSARTMELYRSAGIEDAIRAARRRREEGWVMTEYASAYTQRYA